MDEIKKIEIEILFSDNKMFAVDRRIILSVVACTQATAHILSPLKTYSIFPVALEATFQWEQAPAVAVLSYFQILFGVFSTKFVN
jgi:hypothetical protein